VLPETGYFFLTRQVATLLFRIGRFFCRVMIGIFGRLTVIGQERVPATGGVLVVANHTSYADPPLIGITLSRPVWFMGKSELFDVPLLGQIIPHTHTFPVRRGGVDRQALQTAHKLLTNGEALIIFIEGGRSADGMLKPPTLGPAMIALRAGVPVVPAAIVNADQLLPRHSPFMRFARVKVVYGEPMTFPQYAGKHADRATLHEMSNTLMRRIADLLRENGGGDRVPPHFLEEGSPTPGSQDGEA